MECGVDASDRMALCLLHTRCCFILWIIEVNILQETPISLVFLEKGNEALRKGKQSAPLLYSRASSPLPLLSRLRRFTRSPLQLGLPASLLSFPVEPLRSAPSRSLPLRSSPFQSLPLRAFAHWVSPLRASSRGASSPLPSSRRAPYSFPDMT